MERYVCIHAHFYQPPRENAWLEAVEYQDSAYPYHDWNERVTAECYAPNSASRILDGDGRILQIVNNYSKISFNFGPTLLSWMEQKSPSVYEAILTADRESQKLFSGHGSAVAQAYNHMILPLATRQDKYTQILWGIRDFEKRFGRHPEGMWLPETAVDLQTLEVLADLGIKFTILSPYQAGRARPLGGTGMAEGGWRQNRSFHGLRSSRAVRENQSMCFSTTARSPAPLPLRICWPMASGSRNAFWAHFPTRAPGRNWSTSPPTARPMGIIAPTAIWPWHSPCTISKPASWPS